MGIKVSVIVPAYNAEKYVTHALDSALRQTLQQLEVIVVDDCSTDGTLALLRARYGKDDRVKIVAQEKNGGVSAARNRGLHEATGEYIAFLDSDDAMLPDMYEKMYRAAKEHDADVLHTTGCLLPAVRPVPDDISGLAREQYRPLVPELCEPGDDVCHAPFDMQEKLLQWCGHKYHWSVWNKLFRRSLIEENRICFDKLSMAEDMIFCFKAFFFAKKYTVLPGQWYIYRISDASLSRQQRTVESVVKLTDNQMRAAAAISSFTKEQAYFKEHPAEEISVRKVVCESIGKFYLTPALAELTKEKVQQSGVLEELFNREFGEKSAFVGYLFWRVQELTRDALNVAEIGSNAEKFSSKAEEYKKKKQGGDSKP